MSHTYTLTAEQDDIPVRGNAMASGDDAADRECEDEILARLDAGDVWAWAHVTVMCTCDDCGAMGEDNIGACSYADESEFRADGYYDDMLWLAYEDMRSYCTCWKPDGIGENKSCTAP